MTGNIVCELTAHSGESFIIVKTKLYPCNFIWKLINSYFVSLFYDFSVSKTMLCALFFNLKIDKFLFGFLYFVIIQEENRQYLPPLYNYYKNKEENIFRKIANQHFIIMRTNWLFTVLYCILLGWITGMDLASGWVKLIHCTISCFKSGLFILNKRYQCLPSS